MSPSAAARAFLDKQGAAFGLRDQASELRVSTTRSAPAGRSSVRFQQLHKGVRVLGGELIVNLDRGKNVLSAGGEVVPAPDVSVTPKVDPSTARETAIGAIAKARRVPAASLRASEPGLWIYDSRILGGPGLGRPTLVWRMNVTGETEQKPIDELVLVDAQLGLVALHFDQVEDALDRDVCDANNTESEVPCGTPVRSEGDGPSGIADVNNAYDYSGDTYDFFNLLGRDSIDDLGMTLISTTRYCPAGEDCPFQNAYWNGSQMVYGSGYASADDVVGHELTHGVTERTSHLFYYYQSGAINESLSDIFGELVDQTNLAGDDGASAKWFIGEDLPIGAIRYMKDPTFFLDPDRMTSDYYWGSESDSGGVHYNSGVGNKAASLMTDGGAFNGETVNPLGVTKVATIFYEAETNFLTSAADYADLSSALPQACTNLIGTAGITSGDCAEVTDAVQAVEMSVSPPSAPNPEAPICAPGHAIQTSMFSDNLENTGSGNWTTPVGSEWYYPQTPNPYFFDATWATSGTTNMWRYDKESVTDSSIAMTSSVAIPAGSVSFLRFKHSYLFENGWYDGGVLEYSTNNGSSWNDAGPLLVDNGYGGTLDSSYSNPLGGRDAFVDNSNGYISSRASLNSLGGQSVRFRFRMGTDDGFWDYGWFIDDISIYRCANNAPVARAGGAYTVAEGGQVQLNGSGSSDADGDALTYAWDVDGDQDYNDGVTGRTPVVSWSTLVALGLGDGPATATVRLRATDSSYVSSAHATTLALTNAPPTVVIVNGPTTATAGDGTAWTFAATDVSPGDRTFSYRIDWNGDGTDDQAITSTATASVAHTFTAAGSVTVSVTATDDNGGRSARATRSITIAAAERPAAVKGKIASAKLVIGKKKVTKFKRVQAKKVKLSVKFSPASTKFNYLLQVKKNGKWVKVKSRNRTGSFKNTRTWTLKSLFAGKAVKAGRYRLKLAASGNSKTLSFRVT